MERLRALGLGLAGVPEDLTDAPGPRDRFLYEHHPVGDPAGGLDQHQNVREEGRELADRDAPAEGLMAAERRTAIMPAVGSWPIHGV